MQADFSSRMDTTSLKTNETFITVQSLDELLEVFLSNLLCVHHVKMAEVLLFNKRRDLVSVATATNQETGGIKKQEIRVQSWIMDSPVTHSIRKVNFPNVHFALSIPILQLTEILGFLHIELCQIPTVDRDKLATFYLFSQELAAKIKEIMLSDEIKEVRSELRNMIANNREMLQHVTSLSKELYAISAISIKINQSMDFDRSMRKSITKIREVFKASSIAVYTKNTRTSKFELSAMDVQEDALDTSLLKEFFKKAEKTFLKDIITLGKPLVKELLPTSDEKILEYVDNGKIRVLIGIPLNSKETNIGAMLLLHRSEKIFNQSSLRLLSGMANIMAMAIENMKLYRQTEQKKKEAAFLVSSIARFHKKLDLKETLKSVAEEGAKFIGEQCQVYLFSKTKVPMTQVTYQENGDRRPLKSRTFKEIRPKELKDLYVLMLSQNKSVLIRSINHTKKIEKDVKSYLQERDIHSLMAVPLRLRREILGLLLLVKKKDKRPFDRDDLSFAEALGSAASVAIKNARAYTDSLHMSDFLEKKITEKTSRIEEIEERQKIQVEHRRDIIFRVNRRNRFVFVNKAMETFSGYSREALCRGDIRAIDVVAREDRDRIRDVFKKILSGKLKLVKDFEYRQIDKRNQERIISMTIYPEMDFAHDVIGIEGVGRDITEEKKLEAELKKAKELAMLGEFSSDIAHQIRNPLSNILMGAKLLHKALKLDVQAHKTDKPTSKGPVSFRPAVDELEKIFGDLSEGINNLNRVVTGLLTYTKTLKLTRSVQRIDVILRETPVMFQDLLKKSCIRVEEDFDPDLPPLPVDALLIGQVFQNVFHNAIEAMPHGGCLFISTSFYSERPAYAFISISDSGTGIKLSEAENVFRPFYTTKGTGIGLGLSLAHRIVEAHNGMIWICHSPCPHLDHRVTKYTDKGDNSREKGATIHILLPMDGTLKKPVK